MLIKHDLHQNFQVLITLRWKVVGNVWAFCVGLIKGLEHIYSKIIQSTLVISKSKGPSETVRDIRTSTFQICSIEEKQFEQPTFTNDYVI